MTKRRSSQLQKIRKKTTRQSRGGTGHAPQSNVRQQPPGGGQNFQVSKLSEHAQFAFAGRSRALPGRGPVLSQQIDVRNLRIHIFRHAVSCRENLLLVTRGLPNLVRHCLPCPPCIIIVSRMVHHASIVSRVFALPPVSVWSDLLQKKVSCSRASEIFCSITPPTALILQDLVSFLGI